MNNEIKNWSENLVKEVYDTWKDKYFFWKSGIKIFYSPAVYNPELMIISYQPGGSEKHFEEENKSQFDSGNFKIIGNVYIDTDNRMSREVRNFFDFDGGLNFLKNSVILPLIFFRASSVKEWKGILTPIRVAMEKFSFLKVEEIITTLKPKKILVLGIQTYGELKKILNKVESEKILHTRKNGKEKMVIISKYGNCSIFTVTHLSGARISKSDQEFMQQLLKEWIVA